MAAAQLRPENNDDVHSKISTRVIPIIGHIQTKAFVCTATGLICPGEAFFAGNLPFCSPFAALVFWVNIRSMASSTLDMDKKLVQRLGITPRLTSIAINALTNQKTLDEDLCEQQTPNRGKRSVHTAVTDILISAANKCSLAYAPTKQVVVPISLSADVEDLCDTLPHIRSMLEEGKDLMARFGWRYPSTTVEEYIQKQRDRRTPNDQYAIFECAESTDQPIKPVKKRTFPLEEALTFLKNLVGGEKNVMAVPTENKQPHAYTGISQDGIKYMATRKFRKEHLKKGEAEDDSDDEEVSLEENNSQPVDDDE